MNRPNMLSDPKVSDPSGVARWSALAWNVLAVVFLFAGLVVAGSAIRERLTWVTPELGEFSQVQVDPDARVSVLGDLWMPYDRYTSVFASRDIFKTDEERILESAQQPQMAAGTISGNWGDGYQLIGVIVDEDPRAIIRTLNPPGVQTLAIGDRLGEATLVQVQENSALFDYQDTRAELRFTDKPSK